MAFILRISLLLVALAYITSLTNAATMRTTLGFIEGTEGDYIGKGMVYRFLKIPYAKPPTGNRRFRKPEPYGGWSSTLNAKSFGPKCPQPSSDRSESEDCLHLNIYIPHQITPNNPRSVMVWIHGGSYIAGSASDYDGRYFVLDGDVILVTVNYRLGNLGFLATDDGSIPGNYGLWDQHLAFQWVHDNIADYGGDPNSVTIFGESAGGGSVSFQSLYPGNQGLFQRVIAQSGVALSPVLRRNPPNDLNRGETMEFIKSMNCTSVDVSASLDCLRTLPYQTISTKLITSSPAVDMDFVLGYAENMLLNKSSDVYKFFTSLDYMVGVLDGDGLVLSQAFLTPQVLNQFNTTLANGLPTAVLCQYLAPLMTTYLPLVSPDDICNMYKNSSSLLAQSNAIADLFTDFGFTLPAIISAEYHYRNLEAKKSTYMYMMTQVNFLQYILFASWTPTWAQRASHAMDVAYLFDNSSLFSQADDLSLMKSMRGYWTNFAKTGSVV